MSAITRSIEGACIHAYDVAAMTVDALRHTGEALRRHKLLFKHLYLVGNSSLGIVSLFGFFVGMILVLYAGDTLERFGQQKYVGLTGLAIVWEFGPVFTAFILAGRIGSAYTAEIGTMKVYDEVDALKALGIRPTAYLVTPRLLACLLMLPALACFADLWALLGGAGMGWCVRSRGAGPVLPRALSEPQVLPDGPLDPQGFRLRRHHCDHGLLPRPPDVGRRGGSRPAHHPERRPQPAEPS